MHSPADVERTREDAQRTAWRTTAVDMLTKLTSSREQVVVFRGPLGEHRDCCCFLVTDEYRSLTTRLVFEQMKKLVAGVRNVSP